MYLLDAVENTLLKSSGSLLLEARTKRTTVNQLIESRAKSFRESLRLQIEATIKRLATVDSVQAESDSILAIYYAYLESKEVLDSQIAEPMRSLIGGTATRMTNELLGKVHQVYFRGMKQVLGSSSNALGNMADLVFSYLESGGGRIRINATSTMVSVSDPVAGRIEIGYKAIRDFLTQTLGASATGYSFKGWTPADPKMSIRPIPIPKTQQMIYTLLSGDAAAIEELASQLNVLSDDIAMLVDDLKRAILDIAYDPSSYPNNIDGLVSLIVKIPNLIADTTGGGLRSILNGLMHYESKNIVSAQDLGEIIPLMTSAIGQIQWMRNPERTMSNFHRVGNTAQTLAILQKMVREGSSGRGAINPPKEGEDDLSYLIRVHNEAAPMNTISIDDIQKRVVGGVRRPMKLKIKKPTPAGGDPETTAYMGMPARKSSPAGSPEDTLDLGLPAREMPRIKLSIPSR